MNYDLSTLEPSAGNNDNDTIIVKEARINVTKQNDGLDHFQLIPKTTQGLQTIRGRAIQTCCDFSECQQHELHDDGEPKTILPLDSLDAELSHDSIKCNQPSASELRRAAI